MAPSLPAQPASQRDAATLIAGAAAHLGGLDLLRGVRTLRMEYTTHWFRSTFNPNASGMTPAGSLESNVDTRDYDRPAWRQYRGFGGAPASAPASAGIVNVIVDSVATTSSTRGTMPLNAAYLTERDELFLMAPERLLPRMHDAAVRGDARLLPDTTLNGVPHHAVRATLDARPVTAWISRAGFLAGVRIRAAQPFDFGLAGLGEMDVDVFYAQWRVADGVGFPGHVRVRRAGEAYKELFVQRIAVNPPVPADSVAVSDSLRRVYGAEARRAMFDVTIPPVRVDEHGMAVFGPPQAMPGAVRLRTGWLVLGAGAGTMVMERAVAALRADTATSGGAPRFGAVERASSVSVVITGANAQAVGGAPWAAARGHRVYVPATASGTLHVAMRNQGITSRGVTAITAGSWHQIAGDSVWMEPLEYPDTDGAVLVWVPRLRWAYVGAFGGPIQLRAALTLLDARGFAAERIGNARALSRPAADVRGEAAAVARPPGS